MIREGMFSLTSFRNQFRNNIVGDGVTCAGSFDAVHQQLWHFNTDGSGFYEGRGKIDFAWREVALRTIEICEQCDSDDDSSKAADAPWSRVEYGFKELLHDAGREIVLHQLGQDGFYMSMYPLRPSNQ